MKGKRVLKKYSEEFEYIFPWTDKDQMIKFFGTEVTIVGPYDDEEYCIEIEEDDGNFMWAVEWFEP